MNQVRGVVSAICPRCGGEIEPTPVIYGYPSAELFKEAEAGRVQLGGCVVSGDDPDYSCPACSAELWSSGKGLSDSPPTEEPSV